MDAITMATSDSRYAEQSDDIDWLVGNDFSNQDANVSMANDLNGHVMLGPNVLLDPETFLGPSDFPELTDFSPRAVHEENVSEDRGKPGDLGPHLPGTVAAQPSPALSREYAPVGRKTGRGQSGGQVSAQLPAKKSTSTVGKERKGGRRKPIIKEQRDEHGNGPTATKLRRPATTTVSKPTKRRKMQKPTPDKIPAKQGGGSSGGTKIDAAGLVAKTAATKRSCSGRARTVSSRHLSFLNS